MSGRTQGNLLLINSSVLTTILLPIVAFTSNKNLCQFLKKIRKSILRTLIGSMNVLKILSIPFCSYLGWCPTYG